MDQAGQQIAGREDLRMSFASVPRLARKPWSIIALVLNIFPVAGVGSIIAGIKGRDRACMIVGLMQVVLDLAGVALVYAGVSNWPIPMVFAAWLWSIVWGIRIYRAAR